HSDLLSFPTRRSSDLMFTTGFTMAARDCAEPDSGETLNWMAQQAQHSQAVITGSIITEVQGHFFNRLYWVEPNGSFNYYDKKHLDRKSTRLNSSHVKI